MKPVNSEPWYKEKKYSGYDILSRIGKDLPIVSGEGMNAYLDFQNTILSSKYTDFNALYRVLSPFYPEYEEYFSGLAKSRYDSKLDAVANLNNIFDYYLEQYFQSFLEANPKLSSEEREKNCLQINAVQKSTLLDIENHKQKYLK